MTKVLFVVILSVVAFVLILVGIGFFISSLYFYLLSVFQNPAMAALFCGLVFLLVAILLLMIVILIKSTLFKIKQPKKLQAKIAEIQENPSAQALHLVQEYPFRSALVAVVSGFALGFFPKLRDSLIDGVSTYLNTGSVAESLKSMKSKEEDV